MFCFAFVELRAILKPMLYLLAMELSWVWKIFKENGISSTVQLWDKTSYRDRFYGKDLQTSSSSYLLKKIFLVEFKEFSWIFIFQEFFPALDQGSSRPLVGHQMQIINLFLVHNFAFSEFLVNSNLGRGKLTNVFRKGKPSSGF